MKATAAPDETDALARLREHEGALDRQLEKARAEAAALLAEARAEADRLRDVEAELAEQIDRLRREVEAELEAAVAARRDETARRIAALREVAARNRERALEWLLARVAAREKP